MFRFFHARFRSIIPVMFLALLQLPIATSAADGADSSYQLGIKSYQRGDYYLALEYFRDAIPHELNQPALYYNIGVTHYRLEEYDEADKAFRQVAMTPAWEPLALYNRALIAFRQDYLDLAREFATSSLEISTDSELDSLNQRLLKRLEEDKKEKPGWSSRASFGVGHNDNVTLSDSDAFDISGRSDTFLDLTARMQRDFSYGASRKLKTILEASVVDYTVLNEYDQAGIGVRVEKELDHRKGRIGARLEQTYLGGVDYQLVTTLDYTGAIEPGNRPFDFKYLFSNYESLDSGSAYLGGVRHRFILGRDKNLDKGLLRIYWRLDYNDRQDLQSGTSFYSYSPLRSGLGLVYTRNLASKWTFSGMTYYQVSHFLEPDRRPGVELNREDDFLGLRVRMTRRITRGLDYRLNYSYSINRSNFAEFSYNQNIISAELLKHF